MDVYIYLERQIHILGKHRGTPRNTRTRTQRTQTNEEERRADIKFKHNAIMSLSRFTHVSVLIWNPLPHYPHSILLLIKYLLEFRWRRKYRWFIPQLYFSLDFNYSYSTFGMWCVRTRERERKVSLSDFQLCMCISLCLCMCECVSFSQFYYSVRVSWCFFFFVVVMVQFNDMANTQATGSTAIFFLIIKETNHENYTIWKQWSNLWLAWKKSVSDGILLRFCLTISLVYWDGEVRVIWESEKAFGHCLT